MTQSGIAELYIALVVVGALVLLLGLFSALIHARLPVSIPLLCLIAGMCLGPAGVGILDPARWGARDTILAEAARLTLAIALMATALRLPPRYFLDHVRLQAVLLGVVMPLMWGLATLLVYLWLGPPAVVACLIAAAVTPTDPIVASTIVTSALARKTLPDRIRHALSAESGANDGLAYAFVALPVLLLVERSGSVAGTWLTTALLREIAGGVVVGLFFGYIAGWLLRWGEEKRTIEQQSFLAYTVALALLVVGAAGLLAVNGVLAVFVSGLAFDNMVGGRERAEEAKIQDTVNQFFTLPVFALIGLAAPVQEWLDLGWRGAGLALTLPILRRLPLFLLLRPWMPPLQRRADALFCGWFGPIGVSALLYSVEATRWTGNDTIWTVSSLIICASIAIHGMTATPITKLYGRRAGSA